MRQAAKDKPHQQQPRLKIPDATDSEELVKHAYVVQEKTAKNKFKNMSWIINEAVWGTAG